MLLATLELVELLVVLPLPLEDEELEAGLDELELPPKMDRMVLPTVPPSVVLGLVVVDVAVVAPASSPSMGLEEVVGAAGAPTALDE